MISVIAPLDLESQSPAFRHGAALLDLEGRKQLALRALGGEPIARLADGLDVSRKFVYRQAGKAGSAVEAAFQPPARDDDVLFRISVTKKWVEEVVLSALLHCHGSYRGVQAFLRDTCDFEISVGSIHNIVVAAIEGARRANRQEDLCPIRVGAHDEIFQGDPVLVGVDPLSTYCYLLAQEPGRDGTTWGVHLLDLSQRGLSLDYTVADAGKGLRAGQAEAWPGVPCRGDVFHAERGMGQMAAYLDNRAYGCIGTREKVERQMERDYSPTYWFRVTRARQLLDMYREDPDGFRKLAAEFRSGAAPERRAPHRLAVWFDSDDPTFRSCDDLEPEERRDLLGAFDDPDYYGLRLRTTEATREYCLFASPSAIGTLAYIAFETRRLHEVMDVRGETFVPLEVRSLIKPLAASEAEPAESGGEKRGEAILHSTGHVFDIDYGDLPPGEREALEFVLNDLGWEGYLGFIHAADSRTLHIGCSPSSRDFFDEVFADAVERTKQ
ncbi:MAG: hypothetical protein AAB654_00330 [Acidobacteriota bacterium]